MLQRVRSPLSLKEKGKSLQPKGPEDFRSPPKQQQTMENIFSPVAISKITYLSDYPPQIMHGFYV